MVNTPFPLAASGWIVLALTVYLVPSVVALWRRHPGAGQVLMVNMLLGWTVVGWLWALREAISAIAPIERIWAPSAKRGDSRRQLQLIAHLHEHGILTDEERDAERQRLLDQPDAETAHLTALATPALAKPPRQ